MHGAPARAEVGLRKLLAEIDQHRTPPFGASAREPDSDEENTAERCLFREGPSVRFLHRHHIDHVPSREFGAFDCLVIIQTAHIG